MSEVFSPLWSHQFEIIKRVFSSGCRRDYSIQAFADVVGVPRHRVKAWEKGQRPSADDLQRIALSLDLSPEWILFGTGEAPRREGNSPSAGSVVHAALRPVPMLGLASCGVNGWNQKMPIAVSASPLMQGDRMVAVIAAGESMVPAGIASGQVCYCDPDQQVLEGDAVYVERVDGYANIKLYLGEGERAGWIRLKGWLDPDKHQRRKEFFIDLPRDQIAQIAPIIYVRRRL